MKQLYVYHDRGGSFIATFLSTLPSKHQERLLRQIAMLLLPQLGKPPVKHFQMERYRSLYELRDKYKTSLTRIIFTYDAAANVILLDTEPAEGKLVFLLGQDTDKKESIKLVIKKITGEVTGV